DPAARQEIQVTPLLAAIALLVPWATGMLIVRLAWPGEPAGAALRVFRAGLGFGIGAGVRSLVAFASLFAFGRLDFPAAAVEIALLVALVVASLARRAQEAVQPPSPRAPSTLVSLGHAVLALLASATIAITFWGIEARMRTSPHGGWDAYAIWNL